MIIDCIADLHGHFPQLNDGDFLIVAGDLTEDPYKEIRYAEFDYWLNEQPYKKKIVIAGNHDHFLQQYGTNYLKSGRTYLQFGEYLCDSGTEFEGLKIWGSPWTRSFKRMNPKYKAFTVDTEEKLAEKWALIPDDLDILITHSSPYGILDTARVYGPFGHEREESAGSEELLKRVLDVRPKLHVFAHVRECPGQWKLVRDGVYDKDTQFVNACQVDENYKPTNKPIRIIL